MTATYYYYDFTNGNDSRSGLRIPAGDHNSTSYNTIDSMADTTHFVDSALTGADDYINGSFVYNVTRSAGALITDFDAATDTVTLGTAIAGMSAGDSYYILDARKTMLHFVTTEARSAGDICYLRANRTDTQGSADIVIDESGTAAEPIKVIGCNATQSIDPWHDASDVRPTIDFNDGVYQLYGSSKGYWEFRNLIIQDSFDTNGVTYFAGTSSTVYSFYNCYLLNDNNTGRYLFYANYGDFTFRFSGVHQRPVLGVHRGVLETIALGHAIRDLARLQKLYGRGRWRKMKGRALMRLPSGRVRLVELHWYEAHGIGRRELKRKRYLDQAMAEKRKSNPRFAVCVRNEGYEASLERNKLYVVLPDSDADREGDVRVVDESGQDYLYPADWFVALEVPKAVQESLLKAS